MVLLEAFGLASKEIFSYNRENFIFDQEQRLKKDSRRVELQVARFELFRQDIEDLVQLTVDKMDMYHLVGALFLGFCTTIYTEGRLQGPTPPFFLGAYFMSVAGAVVYLLLTVWLSMHASIASHSFGVRLRTRYVRLPIPSFSQLVGLTAKLADFERQGVGRVMRLPFGSATSQPWNAGQGNQAGSSSSSSSQDPMAPKGHPAINVNNPALLGRGEFGFGKEEVALQPATYLPGKHIQLYRQLQSKWACFDAYARVSMAIGVNQIANSLTYYLIGIALVENRAPAAAYGLALMFQSCALALSILDIAGLRWGSICLVQLLGSMPVAIVILVIARSSRNEDGSLKVLHDDPLHQYILPFVFFFTAGWLVTMLFLAWPSNDEATLPHKFRTVLFLDVFGDVSYDPTEAEDVPVRGYTGLPNLDNLEARAVTVAMAERSLNTAHAALRRWEAVPEGLVADANLAELIKMRREFTVWRRTLQGQEAMDSARRGSTCNASLRDAEELRPWGGLSAVEKAEDEFVSALPGPLGLPPYMYYDLEGAQGLNQLPAGRRALQLQELASLIRAARTSVKKVLEVISENGEASEEDWPARTERRISNKDRLPWKILRRMTCVLATCWCFLGVMQVLQGFNLFQIDYQIAPEHDGEGEERRLRSAGRDPMQEAAAALPELIFRQLELSWPHGSFFRPASLSSLGDSRRKTADVLLSTEYRAYAVAVPERDTKPEVQIDVRLLPAAAWPPGVVALCGSGSCLMAELEEGVRVAFWPEHGRRSDAVILPILGQPWRKLAGALLRCDELAPLLPYSGSSSFESFGWCALLAGVTGEQLLPVAVLPLPGSNPQGSIGWSLPAGTAFIASFFDAPLTAVPFERRRADQAGGAVQSGQCSTNTDASSSGAIDVEVLALHVETAGRLWALLAHGEFQEWDLLSFAGAQRWRPKWPHPAHSQTRPFQPSGFAVRAAGDERELLVVGSSEFLGPALLSAPVSKGGLSQNSTGDGMPWRATDDVQKPLPVFNV